jgi:AraC-like DNA-binding protein
MLVQRAIPRSPKSAAADRNPQSQREGNAMATLHQPPAYGAQMAKYFRLGKAESLLIPPAGKPPLAITRLFSTVGLPERTASVPAEKAFVLSVHLTPASDKGCDIWIDDKHSRIPVWPAGGVGIYDLESNPLTRNPSPIDWVHYHIPRATLDGFADDAQIPRIQHLRCMHGSVDRVLHQMTQLILPSLNDSRNFSDLFLDHFRLLFCSHVAANYGPRCNLQDTFKGGLARWQRKRVEDVFRENLTGKLSLSALADECGLSVSHFARSFRRTFATSPHRYLVLQRISKAKELLTTTHRSLLDVALESGFSDQAAFSRTFKALVGASPGKWQREVLCSHKPIDLMQ